MHKNTGKITSVSFFKAIIPIVMEMTALICKNKLTTFSIRELSFGPLTTAAISLLLEIRAAL
jgi:hypothetical protein